MSSSSSGGGRGSGGNKDTKLMAAEYGSNLAGSKGVIVVFADTTSLKPPPLNKLIHKRFPGTSVFNLADRNSLLGSAIILKSNGSSDDGTSSTRVASLFTMRYPGVATASGEEPELNLVGMKMLQSR